MMDFVVMSSDLWLYVLDTWVKRGAELSADLVSWIRWQERLLNRPAGEENCRLVLRILSCGERSTLRSS